MDGWMEKVGRRSRRKEEEEEEGGKKRVNLDERDCRRKMRMKMQRMDGWMDG